MKNLYLTNQKQKDKNKLYTRWSGYCAKNCKSLIKDLEGYLAKIETPIYFDKDFYNSLDKEQKSYFGDAVDSILSGGSFDKVNCFRVYFHQPSIIPNQEMKDHIKQTDDELLKFLKVYWYDYPRWKTTYYPDGKYKTHLDLIVSNLWKNQEVFDITIDKDKDSLMSKLIELIGLTARNDTFDFVNVLNLYDGTWYSYKLGSNPELEHKCKDLFKSFVEVRINEESEN